MHASLSLVSLLRTRRASAGDDFLLALDDRAAAAAERQQAVGYSIATDGILAADFLSLEEFETGNCQ